MEEPRTPGIVKFRNFCMDNLLTVLMISSIVAGLVAGILVRAYLGSVDTFQYKFLSFPGDVLLFMLKCTATPLILTCLIVALGSLNLTVSKRMCWQLLTFVFCAKIVSVITGLAATLIVRPGEYGSTKKGKELKKERGTLADVFLDMLRNIINGNMIRIYIEQYQTHVRRPKGNNTDDDENTWIVVGNYTPSMNMLGIVLIAMLIGFTISHLQDKASVLLALSRDMYGVSMTLATWVLWVAPTLLFFLIFAQILNIKDISVYLTTWGIFVATMIAAHLCIAFIEYPVVLYFCVRENPYKLYYDAIPALITAFATSSSMATMPIIISCLLKHGVDERVVRFSVPIGTSIHKDGAACYLTTAVIFMAQLDNEDLSWGNYAPIVILCAVGGITAAAVPFSGIVLLIMILSAMGFSQGYVASLLAVEWLIDRTSTLTNVSGNICLCKILDKWNRGRLAEIEDKPDT